MQNSFAGIRALLLLSALALLSFAPRIGAEEFESKPADPFFEKFNPKKAPAFGTLLLKTGDKLAIVGDSITEQKMYSKIIETYLTVCVPELKITARQFGWGGETAEGFLKRMKNDCLRFQPTVATLCYGMNDHKYRAYDEPNGKWYRDNYSAIVKNFKEAGARVVLGSPGCVGKVPPWAKAMANVKDGMELLNLNLCKFRDIDIDLAGEQNERFADVFWPMYNAVFTGHQKYGPQYNVAGGDGVHPGWSGHIVMAYAFLRAMGLDGEIGTFNVDLKAAKATASAGHEVKEFKDGVLTLVSSKYPYCAAGDVAKDSSIRSGMTLVPFNEQLNRLMLIAKGGGAPQYKVTWGEAFKTYSAAELEKGVNLAADFEKNPFSDAFDKVDAAVAAKQAYETKQIKQVFHGPEGKKDMEAAATKTEAERAPLAAAIQTALVPVTHTIKIEAQ